MMDLEERTYLSSLLEIYGSLLTDTQRDILNDYINVDLSLSEIAENNHISRSGVDDAINKATAKLKEYENKLHIYQKQEKSRQIISKLKQNEGNRDKLLEELEQLNNAI